MESRANPTETRMLLRAWMAWRARQHGWVDYDPGRGRLFADEAARLEQDVSRMQPQSDGIFGNAAATHKFFGW
eukprot:1164761-Pyramimonas_sp.AAC.1